MLTQEGRQSMIGQTLNCRFCDMPALPEVAEVYKTTGEFTETSIPSGMLREHRTKAGTWGRIVVREGKLLYCLAEPAQASWMLRPGIPGIIAPGRTHWITPHGRVRFVVEFLRDPTTKPKP